MIKLRFETVLRTTFNIYITNQTGERYLTTLEVTSLQDDLFAMDTYWLHKAVFTWLRQNEIHHYKISEVIQSLETNSQEEVLTLLRLVQ